MVRFQYKVMKFEELSEDKGVFLHGHRVAEDKLNELGADGWRLVTTFGNVGNPSGWVFMREED